MNLELGECDSVEFFSKEFSRNYRGSQNLTRRFPIGLGLAYFWDISIFCTFPLIEVYDLEEWEACLVVKVSFFKQKKQRVYGHLVDY